MEWGKSQKTREPGIYKQTRPNGTVRYRVFYQVPGKGQSTKTFAKWAEAKEFKGKVSDRDTAKRVSAQTGDKTTVAGYFEEWLAGHQKLTASTRRRYTDIGRMYIGDYAIGTRRLSKLERAHIKDWIAEMQENDVGAPTIDKAYRTLRACLYEAVKDGKITANPATRIDTPDIDDRDAFFLTAGQVAAIADELSERDSALVYFLAYTGARIGEASALKVRHVDFLRGQVTISGSSAEVAGIKQPVGKTKSKKRRGVPLFPQLADVLGDYIEKYGTRDEAGQIDPDALLFTGERGAAIRQNNFRSRTFQPAAERAGIVRLETDGEMHAPRVHDLRHTFASLAAAAGYSLHELKTMLGHSTIVLTSNLYAHLYDEEIAAKAVRLGEMMDEARDGGQVVAISR